MFSSCYFLSSLSSFVTYSAIFFIVSGSLLSTRRTCSSNVLSFPSIYLSNPLLCGNPFSLTGVLTFIPSLPCASTCSLTLTSVSYYVEVSFASSVSYAFIPFCLTFPSFPKRVSSTSFVVIFYSGYKIFIVSAIFLAFTSSGSRSYK